MILMTPLTHPGVQTRRPLSSRPLATLTGLHPHRGAGINVPDEMVRRMRGVPADRVGEEGVEIDGSPGTARAIGGQDTTAKEGVD